MGGTVTPNLGELDKLIMDVPEGKPLKTGLHQEVVETLQREISSMTLDNYIVRPHRATLEKYQCSESWVTLCPEERAELGRELAGYEGLVKSLREIASLLKDKAAILMVREQMELIEALQTDAWWQDEMG